MKLKLNLKNLKRVGKKMSTPRTRWIVLGLALLAGLFFYQLGSLTGGISKSELAVANQPIGWHGLYNDPMFAKLNFMRSTVFFLQPDFGPALLRASNAIFGIVAVVAFYFVIRSWHGYKVAFLTTLMFATSAFTLHVSRVATFDVMYLIALPLIFFNYLLLRKYPASKWASLFSLALWINLIYTPGLVWLALLAGFQQKDVIKNSWKHLGKTWKAFYTFIFASSLGLLGYLLFLNREIMHWIGFPGSFEAPLIMLKQLVGVFVHLFVRGPLYPEIWLEKAPILDIFALAMCAIGIYFYATHLSATRTKALYRYGALGVILIALGGPVSIALLVPLLFLLIGTGITYMRQQWLHIFPINPIARNFGVGLIVAAVMLSCIYNLRSYFVAWPHNTTTSQTFIHHR